MKRGWLLVVEIDGGGLARVQLPERPGVASGDPAWVLAGDANRALAWIPGLGAVVCELDLSASSS